MYVTDSSICNALLAQIDTIESAVSVLQDMAVAAPTVSKLDTAPLTSAISVLAGDIERLSVLTLSSTATYANDIPCRL